MRFTRRNFLQAGSAAAATFALPKRGFGASVPMPLLLGSPQAATWWSTRFTNNTTPANMDMIPPVALPNTTLYPGYDYYKVSAREFTQGLRNMSNPTTFWGYNIDPDPQAPGRTNYLIGRQGYIGGVIIGRTGRPIKLEVENCLTVGGTPGGAPLPLHCVKLPEGSADVIDNTIAGSPSGYSSVPGGNLPNRIATHLHGGDARWDSDGHPLTWYSNNPGTTGNCGQYYTAGSTKTPTGMLHTYPNNLSARMLWYHDHAESITRMNAYAGLATGYILRDANEDALVAAKKLPPYIETSVGLGQIGPDIQEWPLVLQEKMFQGPAASPELYYHAFYDPARWALAGPPTPNATGVAPYPSCIPEFYGDVAMVNGVPWPKLDVKAGIYRFRVLNASQARFYNLQIFRTRTGSDGGAIPDFTKPGPQFYQIGTEGGFLPNPVKVTRLLMGPAERADFLIDFRTATPGDTFILYGAAPAPYPGGDPINDYLVDVANGVSGPATLMMFNVVAGSLPGNAATSLPTVLPRIAALGAPNVVMPVTLNEGWDPQGRLLQMIGNFTPTLAEHGGYGSDFLDPANPGLPIVHETHTNGQIEEWSIVNTTADVHPMHFHIVNVQIVSRQSIDMVQFMTTAGIRPVGPAMGPDPNERGWKETVRMYPGQITRVRMIFPPGYTGHYVWHCHILEHEEHDMMHEFELV